MRCSAAIGTRSQYTHAPNASFNGTSSAMTSVRLAPEADMPRSVTPCVVGLATDDDVRRNRLKPGTERSWSSRRSAGVATIVDRSSEVTLLSTLSRVVPASALTEICSAIAAGRSSISIGVVDGATSRRSAANPCASTVMTAVAASMGSATDHVPSAPVVALCARRPGGDRDDDRLHRCAGRVPDDARQRGGGRDEHGEQQDQCSHCSGCALKRYPTPRTVIRCFGRAGSLSM